MDEFATIDANQGVPVPDALTALFNDAEKVRIQPMPSGLPGHRSIAVHFSAGARTVPHKHTGGQHLIVTEGVGVVADENGVHVVRDGDVVTNPPGGWHWHGGTPTTAMTHVTVEEPDSLELDVERGDWDEVYTDDLGK